MNFHNSQCNMNGVKYIFRIMHWKDNYHIFCVLGKEIDVQAVLILVQYNTTYNCIKYLKLLYKFKGFSSRLLNTPKLKRRCKRQKLLLMEEKIWGLNVLLN